MTRQEPAPSTSRIRRMLFSITLITIVAWLVWLLLVSMLQERFIFPRFIANRDVPAEIPPDVETLHRDLGGGERVEAWLLLPAGSDPAPLLVIAHGNAELIDDWYGFARSHAERGYAVLMAEYRDYGRSGGSPTQEALVEDAAYFLEQAKADHRIDGDRVGFVGMSIGTSVLAQLAVQDRPKAMVMIVPPARLDTFFWQFAAPPFLMRHPFRTDLAIQELDLPVLILSNSRDGIIPQGDGPLLHELAPDSTYMEFDGTHNVLGSEAEYRRRNDAIESFLDERLQP